MSVLLALTRRTWYRWFQYKGFFFLLAFGWMIQPVVFLFVWSVAAEAGPIGRFSRDDFIAYYIALIVINQLTFSQTNWTVGDLIRDGTLNSLLLRPMAPIVDTIAAEIAGKAVFLTFAIPAAVAVAVLLRPSTIQLSGNWVTIVAATAIAWGLRFLWGYTLALLAFWTTRSTSFVGVHDSLVFVLGGQVAPTVLLPGGMAEAARWLPYRYMVGFPVEVAVGTVSDAAVAEGILVGTAWLGAAGFAAVLVWSAGRRRYAAVGG